MAVQTRLTVPGSQTVPGILAGEEASAAHHDMLCMHNSARVVQGSLAKSAHAHRH